MTTHVQIAAELLRSGAGFFRTIARQNPQIQRQMEETAQAYDQVAALLETDPNGEVTAKTAANLTSAVE